MADPNKTEATSVFKFKGEWDGKPIDAGVKKSMVALEKATKKVTRGNVQLNKSIDTTAVGLKKVAKVAKVVTDAESERLKFMLAYAKEADKLERSLVDASEKEAEAIRDAQAALEKKFKSAVSGASTYAKVLLAAKDAAKELQDEEKKRKFQETVETFGYKGKDMGKDMAESFADGLDALRAKDLARFAKMWVKEVGHFGKGLEGFGMRTKAKGEASGGAGMQVVGKLMQGAGSLLKFLTSVGPLLSAVSGSMAAVVKLFLDADAAAKDFNKEILATSGSAGFLTKYMGNTGAAAADLSNTLGEIYDSATDIKKNWTWGINKEQHASVINALTAEGVRLDSLKDGFAKVGKGATESAGYVKDWGSMVQMSVAYSRNFGVSLGEITQLQGDMMGELGMGVDSVESSFQYITQGAEESGIAANKFFGMIRAVSSDFGLFNNRMGDSVKLLGMIGRVMSPRNAQKFMQSITGVLGGMSLMDRAVSVDFAGGTKKVGANLQKDADRRIAGLAADVGDLGPELIRVLKTGNPKAITRFMAKHQDKLAAGQREAILDAARFQSKITKGGLFDMASALKDASPFAAIKHLEDVSVHMFSQKFEELSGDNRLVAENTAHITEEAQESGYKLKMGVDQMKEDLVEKLKNLKKGQELTAEQAKLVAKLTGVTGTNAEKANKLEGIDSADLFAMLSEDQKKELQNGAKTIDYQEKIAGLQTSMNDRIAMLVDFLMNQAYKVFLGIWGTLEDFFDFWPFNGGDGPKLSKLQLQVAKTGNKDLMDAISDAKNSDEVAAKLRETQAYKNIGDAIRDGQKTAADLKAKKGDLEAKLAGTTAGTDDAKSIQAELDKAQNDLNAQEKRNQDAHNAYVQMTDAGTHGMIDALGAWAKKYGSETPVPDEPGRAGKVTVGSSVEQYHAAPGEDPDPTPGVPRNAQAGGGVMPAAHISSAQAAGAPASSKPVTVDDTEEATEQQGANTQNSIDSLALKLRQKAGGIVFNGPYLKNQYGAQMENSVYNAASRALFEYWMYQETDRNDALKAIKAGTNVRDMGANFLSQRLGGASNDDAWGKVTDAQVALAKPHAEGGLVGRPAPGEYFASVKPGETIVPEGGGGTTKVILELKGDMLKQIIRATALNTLNEHDRAKTNR